jgi:hypothetical protein
MPRATEVRPEGEDDGGVNRRRSDEPSPRLAVVILAIAFALPFALVLFSFRTTAGLGVTIAVGLPLVAGLTMIYAVLAMRHLPTHTRRYIWACRARPISKTILLVYFVLIVPAALIYATGQVQG